MDGTIVTLILTNFNQKIYCLESLNSVLNQDYPYSEVVVVDDHSTDGSEKLIEQKLAGFHAADKTGKRVVYIRNEQNLGVARTYEKAISVAKGELIVICGGDDVSHPNRARVIAEKWIAAGKSPTVIFHGFEKIDKASNRLGTDWWRLTIKNPIGAAMAFAAKPCRHYSPIRFFLGYEDNIYARRAYAFGDVLYIDDVLVDYRVGDGDSTRGTYRQQRIRISRAMSNAAKQTLLDVEEVKDIIPSDRYREIKRLALESKNEYGAECMYYGSKWVWQRFLGFVWHNSNRLWRRMRRVLKIK